MAGRIPHDLRRSGVKHSINAGVPPHVVMQWSEHRTMSMLLCYAIITLEELRRAGKKAGEYRGPRTSCDRFARSTTGKSGHPCPSRRWAQDGHESHSETR